MPTPQERTTVEEWPEGCGYQGYEFGAGHYPDSICQGGRLFDADNCDNDGNLYDNEEDIPCPICRRAEAIAYHAERNHFGGMTMREARKTARALVTNIRQNRGLAR